MKASLFVIKLTLGKAFQWSGPVLIFSTRKARPVRPMKCYDYRWSGPLEALHLDRKDKLYLRIWCMGVQWAISRSEANRGPKGELDANTCLRNGNESRDHNLKTASWSVHLVEDFLFKSCY